VDLLDVAILVLRLALVGVLYAFLVVVLRAAGRGLGVARSAPAQPGVRTGALRLVVVEAGGSGLTAGQVIDAADGATFGRAEQAAVVVADSAVSAEHARVSRSGHDWVVVDLGSTNGTLVNDAPVNGQTRMHDGDVLGLGGVRLRVVLRTAVD